MNKPQVFCRFTECHQRGMTNNLATTFGSPEFRLSSMQTRPSQPMLLEVLANTPPPAMPHTSWRKAPFRTQSITPSTSCTKSCFEQRHNRTKSHPFVFWTRDWYFCMKTWTTLVSRCMLVLPTIPSTIHGGLDRDPYLPSLFSSTNMYYFSLEHIMEWKMPWEVLHLLLWILHISIIPLIN